MNLCDNCTYAKECALAHAYAGEIIGCPKRKPITNADRIDRERLKEACLLLLDFIDSCPGGDSWLETPDGHELRTDWGYVIEGLEEIKKWAR